MNQEYRLLGLSGRRWPVGENRFFRLLSAHEMVQCDAQAENLAAQLGDSDLKPLAGNAVLISRALLDADDQPVFADGHTVFHTLSEEEINRLAARYVECRDAAVPPIDAIRQSLAGDADRIRWTVMRAFGRLPADEVVQRMSEGDFLYCYVNLMLDGEAEDGWESGYNEQFPRRA